MTTTIVVSSTRERARFNFTEWVRALGPALTAVRWTSLELELGAHRVRFISQASPHAYRGMQLQWALFDDDIPHEVRQEVMLRVRPE